MDGPSRLCGDRYEVRGLLGEGAQGVTYHAVDLRDGRPVAIKRFDVRGAKSWKDVELAEREARVLASLDHPLVPRYIEHFEEDGRLYLVMEKVDGHTLEAIRQQGPMPEGEVRRFLADADRALTYLHGRASPVVHRDIKPRNVIRRRDGSYVLVDFGAVTELMLRKSSSTIVGTMGYMAPEQFQGRALPTTDVYAVGATALAALTGAEPDALPHKGLRVDVRGALDGRATPAMIDSLEQMLEPDPERRAPSLGAALDGARVDASRRSHGPPPGLPSIPPFPHVGTGYSPPRALVDTSKEDAHVKAIRGLLWALWGLGWVIVPTVLVALHMNASLVAPILFVSLALVLVVTWHKGALIRAAVRAIGKPGPAAAALPQRTSGAPRHRVEVSQDQRVRVHTTDLRPEDFAGETEVHTTSRDAGRAGRG